jgi:hypothetical protein
MSDDDAPRHCDENCGPECDCSCHDEPDFDDRVVQGLSDMISLSIESLIAKLHEQVGGLSMAMGIVDTVDDPELQRSFLMATYEAMITHASAARALLASKCGVDDEIMADRAKLMLDIGRAEVAATDEGESDVGEVKKEGPEDPN